MKKKRKYRANPVFTVASVLLCMTLLTSWLTFGLFARYAASGSSSSSATVAVMASDVTVTFDELLLYPGMDDKIIAVTLTNAENGVVCEVAQSYSFSIKQLTGDLPLKIGVYSDINCDPTQKIDVNGNVSERTFAAGMSGATTYYIKVSWDAQENDAFYADEIDYLCLSVTVTQID